jgi:hypothetical protein
MRARFEDLLSGGEICHVPRPGQEQAALPRPRRDEAAE